MPEVTRLNIPILGGTSISDAVKVNNQKTVNLYPKIETPGSKTQIALYHTPGNTQVDADFTGDGRSNGVFWNDELYFVIGNKLVSITTANVSTERGTLNTSTGRVTIAAGRDYLCLVDGTNGYSIDLATLTFAVITDAQFPDDATHVIYLDGYFIVNDAGTDDFYISTSENPTAWDALDFEVASASPDDILALAKFDRDLYAIGEDSTQRYYNSGNSDFPFTPYPNTMEVGVLAPHSVAKSPYGVFWLANIPDGDAVVVRASGGQFEIISDPDTSSEISRLETKTDAIGSVYTEEGHSFYVLTFPTDQLTKVFDVTTGMWHNRESSPLSKWRISGIGYDRTRILGVDFTNGKIYHISRSIYTDDTGEIIRIRRTQVFHSQRREFIAWAFECEVESGEGTSGDDDDPQIAMKASWNGGRTWSNNRTQSMGEIGEYDTRPRWGNLGRGHELIHELRTSAGVPVTIIAGNLDIELVPL
jgi:hypothetical protein